jgi:hypothetical protein
VDTKTLFKARQSAGMCNAQAVVCWGVRRAGCGSVADRARRGSNALHRVRSQG